MVDFFMQVCFPLNARMLCEVTYTMPIVFLLLSCLNSLSKVTRGFSLGFLTPFFICLSSRKEESVGKSADSFIQFETPAKALSIFSPPWVGNLYPN